MSFHCPDCQMLFSSSSLYNKHRSKFCVGPRDPGPERRERRSPAELRGRTPLTTVSPARSGVVSRSTVSSMSIRLPSSSDEDEAPLPADHENRQRHLQNQANMHGRNLAQYQSRTRALAQQKDGMCTHGRNLAQYQSRTRALAQQKDEIDRRLRELGTDPATARLYPTQPLRDLDETNRLALNDIRDKMRGLGHGRVTPQTSKIATCSGYATAKTSTGLQKNGKLNENHCANSDLFSTISKPSSVISKTNMQGLRHNNDYDYVNRSTKDQDISYQKLSAKNQHLQKHIEMIEEALPKSLIPEEKADVGTDVGISHESSVRSNVSPCNSAIQRTTMTPSNNTRTNSNVGENNSKDHDKSFQKLSGKNKDLQKHIQMIEEALLIFAKKSPNPEKNSNSIWAGKPNVRSSINKLALEKKAMTPGNKSESGFNVKECNSNMQSHNVANKSRNSATNVSATAFDSVHTMSRSSSLASTNLSLITEDSYCPDHQTQLSSLMSEYSEISDDFTIMACLNNLLKFVRDIPNQNPVSVFNAGHTTSQRYSYQHNCGDSAIHREIDRYQPTLNKRTLLAEIRMLRELYIRQGGNHTRVLAQIAELEDEAQLMGEARREKPAKSSTLEDEVASYEAENRRLQRELLDYQDRNNRMLSQRANGLMDDAELERLRKHQDVYKKRLDDMEQEIERLRQQARQRPEPPQPQFAPQPQMYEALPPEMPVLLPPQPGMYRDNDAVPNGPYDKRAGFMVFYDFALGLDADIQAVRLVVSLYNNAAQYGQPSVLPTVYTEGPGPYDQTPRGPHGAALISAKQPVPRCSPDSDLSLVVELQVSGPGGRLSTRGWSRLTLFDEADRLLSGRWRLTCKTLPIRPNPKPAEFYRMPPYGSAEIFVRVVNNRDADAQSMMPVDLKSAIRYQEPLQASPSRPHLVPPPPPSVTPPDTPDSYTNATDSLSPREPEPEEWDPDHLTLGFQVDHVKNAESGEGKVRITAYSKTSGRVLQSDSSPVTATTTSVKSNFRHHRHVFGHHEAVYHDVRLGRDALLLVRFYLRRSLDTRTFDDLVTGPQTTNGGLHDDETLVAWTTMPLMSQDRYRVSTGTHHLPLYAPPVPEPDTLPLDRPRAGWARYNDHASIKFRVFVDRPRPVTDSEGEEEGEEEACPEYAWIEYSRPNPPSEPYNATDGIDVYIDGCRNLPDAVTFTRVAGRILNRSYDKSGKDFNTSVRLDSDIYNPVYDFRGEVREPNLPPTATLLLKVYTIDRFNKEMTVAGYATLNVFVETGSDRPPPSDTPGIQISLNEGAHQLRLYQLGPDGIAPLTSDLLLRSGVRHVPAATILVRLVKAAIGPQGRPLEAEKVPQSDWERLGVTQPRPSYDSAVYQSLGCRPTRGEVRLLQYLVRRVRISVRESLYLVLSADEARRIRTDKHIESYIRTQLTRLMDSVPEDINLTFVAAYNPKLGFKFALDNAVNLPWSNYTHAHYCLNPPAAFYRGSPFAAYDKLNFTQELDPDSTNKSPMWKDGFKTFANRSHQPHMVMIVHLQEIQVSIKSDSYKYGLMDQAWTAIPIFTENYANTTVYQAPLYLGSPSTHTLRQLTTQPAKEWARRAIAGGTIKLIPGASVIVRVADTRREDELPAKVLNNAQIPVDMSLLPEGGRSEYSPEDHGRVLARMVPQGREVQEFFSALATKFKSLVYKLYEEGNVNAK